MPNIKFIDYCNLWNYRNGPYAITDAATAYANSVTPGVAIMKELKKILKPTDTQDMKMECLFKTFVEYSRLHDWVWAGAGSCGSPRLLDAPQPPLECQAFAVALMALAISNDPFGLAVPLLQVAVSTYVGGLVKGSKVGFFSHHPKSGVMGCMPNVHSEGMIDESLSPGFRWWQNHKVLKYGGKYFDPSYGCQWASLDDMTYLAITDFGITGQSTVDYTRWDSASDNDNEGKCWLQVRSKQGRTYYMKVRPISKRASTIIEFDGPFASL